MNDTSKAARRTATAIFVVILFGANLAAAETVASVEQTAEPTDEQTTGGSPQSPDDGAGWWTPHYLVDYGIVALGATGYFVGERLEPRRDALIGPGYDPGDPTPIFETDRLDRTYLEQGPGETVSEELLQAMMLGTGLSITGLEATNWATGAGSAHQLHEAVVGFAEATAVTATITSLTKPFFARLRPDFTDRALRYHCSVEPDEYDQYCDGYRDRPLAENPDEAEHLLMDGRRSFISGHASHSFNTFSYASLVVGGHWVWGDDATTATRIAGVTAQTALMGTATFVTASRITDGRHHLTDVIAGGLVGMGVANLAYWRRFDPQGQPRRSSRRALDVRMALHPQHTGLVLTIQH